MTSPTVDYLDNSNDSMMSPLNTSNKIMSPPSSSPRSTFSSLGFTSRLEDVLHESRSKIDAFCQESKKRIDVAIDNYSEVGIKEQDSINKILKKLNDLKEQRHTSSNSKSGNVSSIQSKRKSLRKEQQKLESEIAELHLNEKELKSTLHIIKKEERDYHAKAMEAREAKNRVEESKRVTIEDLSLGVLKYSKLGLTFGKVAENQLRFTFQQIDVLDEKRQCSFVLSVDSYDVYKVTECEPALSSQVLTRLLDDLNSNTSDVSSFVRSMRSEFKAFF